MERHKTLIRILIAVFIDLMILGVAAYFYITGNTGLPFRLMVYGLLLCVMLLACLIFGVKDLSPAFLLQVYFSAALLCLVSFRTVFIYEKIAAFSLVYLTLRILGRKEIHAVFDTLFAAFYGVIFTLTENLDLGRLRNDYAGNYIRRFGMGSDSLVKAVLPQAVVLLVLVAGMFLFTRLYPVNGILSLFFIPMMLAVVSHEVVLMVTDSLSFSYGMFSLGVAAVLYYLSVLSPFKDQDQMAVYAFGTVAEFFVFFLFFLVSLFDRKAGFDIILFVPAAALLMLIGCFRDSRAMRIVGIVYAGLVSFGLLSGYGIGRGVVSAALSVAGVLILALVILTVYVTLEKRKRRIYGSRS